MTFTEANTVEQMILDTLSPLSAVRGGGVALSEAPPGWGASLGRELRPAKWEYVAVTGVPGRPNDVMVESWVREALIKLKGHLSKEGLQNVEVIKGAVNDPMLPAGQLDAALIVNAYHEMTEHEAILRHVRAALKSGGTFVLMEGIWDSREGQSRDEQIKHHQLAPRLARQEVLEAGFDIVEVRDPFLERAPDEDGKSRWWVIVPTWSS